MYTTKTTNIALALLIGAAVVAAFFINPFYASALNTHSVDLEKDSSQYLSAADSSSLSITGNYTVEAWIKLESLPGNGVVYSLVQKNDGGSNRSTFFQVQGSGSDVLLTFGIDETGNNSDTSSIDYVWNPSVSTWYHVAGVFTASTGSVQLFVNGSSVASNTGSATSIYDGDASTYVGFQGSLSRYFDGKIDEVRIWNVARTQTEISDSLYTELNGNETGLKAYWKLNNSLADDSVGSGYENTLTNNNGASFVADTPVPSFTEILKVRKNANESLTSSETLQNDDQLKLSLASNKTYIIDGVIFASSTSATPDIDIAFFGQTGVDVAIGYTNDVNEMVLVSGEESNRINLPANTPTSIHIHGTVKTGSTSGDLQLKWAQATSNGNATTVMKGSYLRAEEI